MIVWCTLVLSLSQFPEMGGVETALRGKVLKVQDDQLLVDFSEYAKSKDYVGNFSRRFVKEDDCIKE